MTELTLLSTLKIAQIFIILHTDNSNDVFTSAKYPIRTLVT